MIFDKIKSAISGAAGKKQTFPYDRTTSQRILDEVKKRSSIPMLRLGSKKKDDDSLGLTDSKFGGYPYWEKGRAYPESSEDGEKLVLLCQLNFAKIPAMKDFPKNGILQFFVKADDLYGCDFGAIEQKNWRVVYHEEVKDSMSMEEFRAQGIKTASDIALEEDRYLPLEGGFELEFFEDEDFMPACCDERFDRLVREISADFKLALPENEAGSYDLLDEDTLEEFCDECNQGHKIGGYPTFTQSDPRSPEDGYDVLLLQIDTDEGIMWGDSGVGNFFIKREDLKNKDFSKVLYNWDCC